ncbi:MAG TPA: A/G-specific adenine glycosylase [Gammaproteobacteria bacterium]|jgi:A/G-specific adenine glycosylase|nr:A/G-specific adenine glycosylase [Gammaproteobacteria bacterium]
MSLTSAQFSQAILRWFDKHGRKHLPWQKNKTPYRVWISEIMLQQTQVAAVIPYFERFMQRFPDLLSLANADQDAVLHQWAGLGYYSRARNLHRAAQIVMQDFNGKFPDNLDDLQELPGIGRSTAGAILSIAFQQRATILDGNVKRVLARYLGVTDPIDKKVENKLWDIASEFTPKKRSADYTQAIMDLGATLCTRSKPECSRCPLQTTCHAHAEGLAELLPIKKSGRGIPTRTVTFLVLRADNKIFLQKRPPHGIWGGLWSLPEISGEPDKKQIRAFCRTHFQLNAASFAALPAFRHTFSHYHLNIHPIVIQASLPAKVMEYGEQIWYNLNHPEPVGLPKPVQTILRKLP